MPNSIDPALIEDLYHPLPQPSELTLRECEDAMGAYLMMFAAIAAGLPLPILNLLASVVYYFVNRGVSRFVHFHALQALLAQIPVTLMNASVVFWTIRTLVKEQEFTRYFAAYVATVVVVNILYLIVNIIAALRARKGRFYYMLIFGRIAYHVAYVRRIDAQSPTAIINQPPRF